MISDCLKKVTSGENLSEKESYQCMTDIMSGQANDAAIAGLLTALSMKGESVDEITGFVKAMREVSIKVSASRRPLVDTCGTGGDKFKTFNISTASAIIAASCGVKIAKHGNRSITSKCGGADILEALGVNINCDAAGVGECLESAGIGFMFAPNFHPAMGRVMPVRKELGIRTVFNILGPLTSPAGADVQLLGVFDPDYVEKLAYVLRNLKVKRAMVVHGFDGSDAQAMDEISTLGKTKVAIVDNSDVKIQELYPEDFGVKKTLKKHIEAPETLDENLDVVLGVLRGKKDDVDAESRLDLCLVNAGAILFIAGKASGFKEGVEIARESVEQGDALKKLDEFIKISNQFQ